MWSWWRRRAFCAWSWKKAAVELVCGEADEEDLQWLDENIRLQEFYLEGGSSRKLLELDNEMHRKLFSICRKELTYEMCQRLAIHYDRIRSLSVAAVKDHKIIEDHKNCWRQYGAAIKKGRRDNGSPSEPVDDERADVQKPVPGIF